jgi:hypothetical protein
MMVLYHTLSIPLGAYPNPILKRRQDFQTSKTSNLQHATTFLLSFCYNYEIPPNPFLCISQLKVLIVFLCYLFLSYGIWEPSLFSFYSFKFYVERFSRYLVHRNLYFSF